MARVRVLVYREGSDTVLEDLVCEDPDRNSRNLADSIVWALTDKMKTRFTEDVLADGETV